MMLKEQGKEYRTLRLYGQEINLITSGIARMDMLLHGFEEFNIVRGNTLSNPIFMEYDELQRFDIVLANPPYSIKSWDQAAFTDDRYGRNIWGTPPQGCADYAFQQHIMKSLKTDTGRCVVLWPHGILFRDAERGLRHRAWTEFVLQLPNGGLPADLQNAETHPTKRQDSLYQRR